MLLLSHVLSVMTCTVIALQLVISYFLNFQILCLLEFLICQSIVDKMIPFIGFIRL